MDDEELFMMLSLLVVMMCHQYNIMLYRQAFPGRGRGNRRWWRRPLNNSHGELGEFNRLFREMKETDHEEFKQYTRMSPEQFDWLHEQVSPLLLKRSRRQSFSPELRLAFTLTYLAHGDSVWGKKWAFRIGRSTAYKIIPETCVAIVRVLQPLYLPPVTQDMWYSYAQDFWRCWQFPNCIGAIDGKHIRIKAPPNSGSLFYNYKKFFSLVLMAACNAHYVFTYVDLGFYGSMSDGQIWNECDFGMALEEGRVDLPPPQPLPGGVVPMPFTFVGDEAFGLKTFMMRPYAKPKRRRRQAANANNQEREEEADDEPAPMEVDDNADLDPALQAIPLERRIFNYRLSRARRVIENAFGILCARWQILLGSICCNETNAENIVMALLCLHNFLIESELPEENRHYNAPGLVDGDGPNGEPQANGNWRDVVHNAGVFQRLGRVGGQFPARAAIEQRERLKEFFMSEHGEVPWQYDYALRNVPMVRGPM